MQLLQCVYFGNILAIDLFSENYKNRGQYERVISHHLAGKLVTTEKGSPSVNVIHMHE